MTFSFAFLVALTLGRLVNAFSWRGRDIALVYTHTQFLLVLNSLQWPYAIFQSEEKVQVFLILGRNRRDE